MSWNDLGMVHQFFQHGLSVKLKYLPNEPASVDFRSFQDLKKEELHKDPNDRSHNDILKDRSDVINGPATDSRVINISNDSHNQEITGNSNQRRED